MFRYPLVLAVLHLAETGRLFPNSSGTPIDRLLDTKVQGCTSYDVGQPPLYYHTWLLTPAPNGCLVVTEEVDIGPGAHHDAQTGDTETYRHHELWLASLPWVSGE